MNNIDKLIKEKFDISKLKECQTKEDLNGDSYKYYKLGRKTLLSPSKLLRVFYANIYNTSIIPDSILKKAQERGTLFHKEVECINKGIKTYSVDKELKIFTEKYTALKEELEIEPILYEIRLFSEKVKLIAEDNQYGLQAISDCLALVKGKLSIIEYKFISIMDKKKLILSQVQSQIASLIIEEELGIKPELYTLHWDKKKENINFYKVEDRTKINKLVKNIYDAYKNMEILIKERKENGEIV